MKLKIVGIKIYAAIDAYSCHVQWIYVGITACTQISVYCQYLNSVKSGGIIPALIRADRGVKTQMVANAHYRLLLTSCSVDE